MTENSMVIPHPNDPFHQPEPQRCAVMVPIGPQEAINVIARAAESTEAAWEFLDDYVAGIIGRGWLVEGGEPLPGGVRVICRRNNA